MSLGSFLRSERKLKGYTQSDAANAAGVVVPVVSKWENDKSVPDLAAACALCALYNLRIDEFINMRRNESLPRVLPPVPFNPRVLGEACRKLRVKNGYSQSEIGARLFVTSQTVSKWESGSITQLDTFESLAAVYNISAVELLCGNLREENSEAMPPEPRSSYVPRKKRAVRFAYIAAGIVFAACLVFGGFFIGGYFNEQGNNTTNQTPILPENPGNTESPDNTQNPDNTESPDKPITKPDTPKEYVTLTYHFPDGTTESHTLKAGQPTMIEPSYMYRDTACFQYKGYENGTMRLFGSRELYNVRLDYDIDLYPYYMTRWVDIPSAKSQAERELLADVEAAFSSAENLLSGWVNIIFGIYNKRHEEVVEGTFGNEESEFYDTYVQFIRACEQLTEIVKEQQIVKWAYTRIQTLLPLAETLKSDMLEFVYSLSFPNGYGTMDDEEKRAVYVPIMENCLRMFGNRCIEMNCLLFGTDDKAQCLNKGVCGWYGDYREKLGKEKCAEILGL